MKRSVTFLNVEGPAELESLTKIANDTVAAEMLHRYIDARRTCTRMWAVVVAIGALGLGVFVVENSPLRRHLCGRTLRCELVVCVCNESLSWVRRAASSYDRITVYTKCGSAPHFQPSGGKKGAGAAPIAPIVPAPHVVPLPNVGNHEFAYLVHILQYWEELAPEIVFSEGEHMRQRAWQRLAPGAWNPQSLRLGARISDLLPLWTRPCRNETTGSAQHAACKEPQSLRAFSMASWHPKSADGSGPQLGGGGGAPSGAPSTASTFVLSGYTNHEEWLRATMGVPLAEWLYAEAEWVSHTGYFMASRAEVLRYPPEVYARLQRQQRYASEEVDHFIERTWGLLFTARGHAPAPSARQAPPRNKPQLPPPDPRVALQMRNLGRMTAGDLWRPKPTLSSAYAAVHDTLPPQDLAHAAASRHARASGSGSSARRSLRVPGRGEFG